jgi:Metallo-peptidase family M12B Reprolysin-like
MDAGTRQLDPKQRVTSRSRLLALVLILFSACFLPTGSGRSVSGDASREISTRSFPTQDRTSRDEIWEIADRASLQPRVESVSPRAYQVVKLHADALSRALANAPMEFTKAARKIKAVVSLPMPDGTFARFRIEESPVMAPDLAAQFPEVRSYRGQGLDDPTATARFDWSPNGFHGTVLSAAGTMFVAPYTAGDSGSCISYYKEDFQEGFQPPQCEVTGEMQASAALRGGLGRQFSAQGFAASASVGTTLRTYRLALATTVEYTNNATYGGTKASTLTKLNTIVNLINAIYEREVSIRFQLVSGELSIIFDTEPDGYTNSTVGTMLNENPTVLNATIGSDAYDIGHVLGLSSAGSSSGVAQIGVVCGPSKGSGASVLGIALVTGNFSIDSGLVAHEWGHQFSADHTFNSTSNFCGSSFQRSAATAFEPGSGSTIMAYPGICSPENLQQNSDSYFHGGSFDEIASYSASSGACATSTATGNNPPTVSAGADFTIPKGTPFTLTATGSDPDGDALTFSWEELDLGTASPPMTDDGSRPLFRSFPALTSPSRTFPKLSDILNNVSTIGESLPTTTRAMNFRVTARDNRATGGGVNSDAMILNVTSTSGPFVVTQPNTAVTWAGGTSQTVTWSVANTSGPPVNCANVKISLSTDGGNTFPLVLAASTPNDGSEPVVIPNTSTTTARVKVEAVGNVFFDTSNANFTITLTQGGAFSGFHDGAGCNTIQGWAWDANNPSNTVNVDIYDGNTLIATTPANMYREDLLNALSSPNHGFSFLTPPALKNGAVHTINVKFSGTNTLLSNTGRTIQCSLPSSFFGRHDGQGCNAIEGWAWDGNDKNGTVNVDIYDGTTLIGTVACTLYRQDLADNIGSPYHGFIFHTPPSLRDGQPHTITVKFSGTNTNLPLDTPRTTSCTSSTPNYQGSLDVADCNFISGYAWDANDDQGTINAAIYVDGGFFVVVPAQEAYAGIGTGFHGFKFAVPASLKGGQQHSISVKFSGTSTNLSNTPKTITCP